MAGFRAQDVLRLAAAVERGSEHPLAGAIVRAAEAQEAVPAEFVNPDPKLPPGKVVLSYGLWQRRFGGDPDVVGKTILMDGWGSIVLGVLPRDFRIYLPADAAMPTNIDAWGVLPSNIGDFAREAAWLTVVGRLKKGVTVAQAQSDFTYDFVFPGPFPIIWHRYYSSARRDEALPLGFGHTHEFDHALQLDIDGDQERVADVMAERVVDRLEVVDVHEQHGGGAVARELRAHALHEQRPVGKVGEGVVQDPVSQRLVGGVALERVGEDVGGGLDEGDVLGREAAGLGSVHVEHPEGTPDRHRVTPARVADHDIVPVVPEVNEDDAHFSGALRGRTTKPSCRGRLQGR